MPIYTVKAASKKKDVPDAKFGPAQVIDLTLSNGTAEKQVEWFTKATTPLPAEGSTLEGEVTQGQYGLSFKKASQGGGYGNASKDAYWERKEERDIAGQVRMGRAHSQEMALRAVDIFTTEGWREDDLKKKVKEWTDWFVADLNNAPTQSSNGGAGAAAGGSSPDATAGRESVPSASPSAAARPMTDPQYETIDRDLKRAKVDSENRSTVMAWAKEVLTVPTASAAIDGLKERTDETVGRLILAAQNWAKSQSDVPGDETDLPTLDGEYAEEQMAVGEAEEDIPF